MFKQLARLATAGTLAAAFTLGSASAAGAFVWSPTRTYTGTTQTTCDAQYGGVTSVVSIGGDRNQVVGMRIHFYSTTQKRWLKSTAWSTARVPYRDTADFTTIYRPGAGQQVALYIEYGWWTARGWSIAAEWAPIYTQSAGYYGGYASTTCRV